MSEPQAPPESFPGHAQPGDQETGPEPDTEEAAWEGDSSLGIDNQSTLTESVASSIFKYREILGRTYHNSKNDQQYFFPNDEEEIRRLELTHAIISKVQGGNIYIAPISAEPKEVLDVGTGAGTWAIDFADMHPESQVLGTDLSPTMSLWVPPNCKFEVDDANMEWTFGANKFDYIHIRSLQFSVEEKRLFKQAYDALKPGGWLESGEMTVMTCDDGTWDGTAVKKWNDSMVEAGRKAGFPFDKEAQYKGFFEETGFVNVTERKFPIPNNTWPKDKDLKVVGHWSTANYMEGLHGWSSMMFTHFLGYTQEELEVFLVQVRKDIQNRRIHVYNYFQVVYGQKPLEPAAKS